MRKTDDAGETKSGDAGKTSSQSTADVVTLTREEYETLTTRAEGGGVNPEPAHESGPHLDDPAIRAAKLDAMTAHGWDADTDGLTDDMRDILKEG